MYKIKYVSNFETLVATVRKDLKSLKTKLLTKIAATQNEAALSYHRERGLYFPVVIFASIILIKTL